MTNFATAITTCNRHDVLQESLAFHRNHTPKGVPIFVVDDCSDTPPPIYCDYRFTERSGISKAKNKCLELLMGLPSHVEHFFLFDNDTRPIADNWHVPYTQSPIKHLCYTFYDKGSRTKVADHKVHQQANGCMLYVHRSVVERIGGFDTDFYNKYEHSEYSRRIYNAGIIPHPFIDVLHSDKLIYCHDQNRIFAKTMSTEPKSVTAKYLGQQSKLFYSKAKDKHFKPYITPA